MECARAMRHRERIACADILSEVGFEPFGLGSSGDPPRAQRVDYFSFFVGADCRAMKRYLSHHRYNTSRPRALSLADRRQLLDTAAVRFDPAARRSRIG